MRRFQNKEPFAPKIQTSKTSPIAKNRRRAIKVIQSGQFVYIFPAVPRMMNDICTVVHRSAADQKGALAVNRLPMPLVWPGTIGTKRCLQGFAGLDPILVDWLAREGYTVRLAGNRPGELSAPNQQRLACFSKTDDGLLRFIQHRSRGLVRFNGQFVSPTMLVAQIARAWPKLSILIGMTRQSDVDALWRALRPIVPSLSRHTNRTNRDAKRVAIATLAYLRVNDIWQRDLFISLNPTELFGGWLDPGIQALHRLWRARAYAFLADDVRVAPMHYSLLTALFGPREFAIPSHGCEYRDVRVVFGRICGGPRPPTDASVLELKRSGIWQHPVRNRRIAALVRNLAHGQLNGSRNDYPGIERRLPRPLEECSIEISVENVEHALALHRLLPDALLRINKHAFIDGLPDNDARAVLRRPDLKRGVPVITTHEGSGVVCDIMIRADGAQGVPDQHHVKLTQWSWEDRPLLVVDFDDRHHPVLRRLSRDRRQAYIDAGWHVEGVEPLSVLDQFLLNRPKVDA
jgi:hypothetical protein